MPVLNMHFFCRLLVDNFEWHLIKKSGGGRGKTTYLAHYPLKPLNIKLDKVSCPTVSLQINKFQIHFTLPFSNGQTVPKKEA